jgi:alkanesulfonate monooxygenase SsuD/methylene tetrahydromethanopterin reductase-like flavin-dependent oxidoreductase (luciferase family)
MGGMIRHMQTDLLLIPMGARWADMRAAAVAADESGFDGVWTWDHLRDPDGGGAPPEAWTVLTALAEATKRVMLGPLVLNVANRHPGVLASMAATLQAVSGGRLLLGIGAGGSRRTPYAAEQAAIGQTVEPDAVRAQRVVDAIALMRKLWAGEAGFARPEPPPPIIVGGFPP